MRIYYINEEQFWTDVDEYRRKNGRVSAGYDKALDLYWLRDYSQTPQ